MRKSLRQNFTQWCPKGMLGLFSAMMLMVLVAPQVSTAHASNAIPQDITSVFNLRTTFNLGGFGPNIAMLNEHEGWGNSFKGTVHTSDGGQTWQVVTKLDQPFGGPGYVFDGQTFWDQTIDFNTYQAPSLVRTNDGGKTWTSFINPAPTMTPHAFSIIDEQRTWVTMYDYNTNEQALYLVGAGNQNWQKATLPTQNMVSKIHFLSDHTGWLVSGQDLYMTNDGAQTWIKQDLPRPEGITNTFSVRNISPLGFAGSTIGFLQVKFVNPEDNTPSTYIYRTLDAGHSWNVYGSAQPADTDHIAQIDIWNLPNPALVGFRPDRGAEVVLAKLQLGTWKTENVATPAQVPDNCPYCFYSRLSSHLIFLSANASDYPAHALDLYKSTDGGQTWQKVGSTPGEME